MMEYVGWLGSILFALSALPQTVKTVRTKKAGDISWGFLGMWFGGEVCMIAYAAVELKNAPLLFNYIGNMACLLPIIYYKFREVSG